MNPYSIEGWVSRIKDRECSEFFLNSENYVILKNRVCNSFSEAFLKYRFNNDSFRYNEEGKWYWKLKNGEIAIINPHDLLGDVTHFFETGRVIQKSTNRTGTLVETSSYSYNIVKWDISNRFGSGIDRFEDVKSELEWLTVIKDNSISSSFIRKPGSVLTAPDIGARVSRNQNTRFPKREMERISQIGTITGVVNLTKYSKLVIGVTVKWDNDYNNTYDYYIEELIYAFGKSVNSVNSVIVPNILPTIKKGEMPTGIILKPKTKKSIVINTNLQFRKVVV